MKQWLTSVAAASLLSTLAMALCPAGRVRHVTRLVCGLVCALALVSPVFELDVGRLSAGMAEYEQKAQSIALEAREEEKMLERTYIQERCEAYILAKAAETGAAVDAVSVLARWDDEALAWYPWQAELRGAYDEALSLAIQTELGIPPERQEWSGP